MLDHISSISDHLSFRLAQMLRQNGGCNVVVAAPEGLKMELAKKLGAGDVIFFTSSPPIFWLTHSSHTSNFLERIQKYNLIRLRKTTHTGLTLSLKRLDLQRFSKMRLTTFDVEGKLLNLCSCTIEPLCDKSESISHTLILSGRENMKLICCTENSWFMECILLLLVSPGPRARSSEMKSPSLVLSPRLTCSVSCSQRSK